jgi:hypothetical protein
MTRLMWCIGTSSSRCSRSDKALRVCARIEATTLRLNVRFVVTSIGRGSAEHIYDIARPTALGQGRLDQQRPFIIRGPGALITPSHSDCDTCDDARETVGQTDL